MNQNRIFAEAIRSKNISKVDDMIASGFELNTFLNDDGSPLMIAVGTGEEHLVLRILAAGAYVDIADSDGVTPFHFAVCEWRSLSMLGLLLEYGADINFKDDTGTSPLLHAAMRGHDAIKYSLPISAEAMIAYLVQHGADPNSVDNTGRSVLAWAVTHSPLECVKLLLENKAHPNLADYDGWTPMHWAARSGLLEVINLLYDYGANPNFKTIDGRSPWHIADASDHEMAATQIRKFQESEST